jgi:hypothetical protein
MPPSFEECLSRLTTHHLPDAAWRTRSRIAQHRRIDDPASCPSLPIGEDESITIE